MATLIIGLFIGALVTASGMALESVTK